MRDKRSLSRSKPERSKRLYGDIAGGRGRWKSLHYYVNSVGMSSKFLAAILVTKPNAQIVAVRILLKLRLGHLWDQVEIFLRVQLGNINASIADISLKCQYPKARLKKSSEDALHVAQNIYTA
jgi:hypothetical protein